MLAQRKFEVERAEALAVSLAQLAVGSLLEEARLTPKPGLIDRRGSGAHHDMDLALMEKSAHALEVTFYRMALAGWMGRHWPVGWAGPMWRCVARSVQSAARVKKR